MDWRTIFTILVTGLPATMLGVLAYRRSRKVDAVAQQSGVATESRAGTAQIIEGLNALIDNLQIDNKVFREDVKYLTIRLDAIAKERDELRKEVSRLRRKYGEEDPEEEPPSSQTGRHRA